jgi:glucose/arabinose dehydrogenase
MVRVLAQATLLTYMACTPLTDGGRCYAQQQSADSVRLSLFSDEFDLPVQITSNPFRPDEIVVVERDGLAKSISKRDRSIREVLDIEDLINENHRHGLMSISYSNKSEGGVGEFFANYIDIQGDLVVVRFPDRSGKLVDEQQMSVVIKVAQISANTYGSQLHTRLDNSLLVTTGDGGDSPTNTASAAQSPRSLLGKVLRVIPKGTGGYSAPTDPPTANANAALPEVWASGFRNPEYLSIDSTTGDVFVVDNGATQLEINVVQANKNYGWDQMEGNTCLKSGCNATAYSSPALALQKTSADARLIGGVVYRGKNIPELAGKFIFAENSSATLFAAELGSDKTWRYSAIATVPKKEISAIGQDASGEVYVATRDGSLFLIASAADRTQ